MDMNQASFFSYGKTKFKLEESYEEENDYNWCCCSGSRYGYRGFMHKSFWLSNEGGKRDQSHTVGT